MRKPSREQGRYAQHRVTAILSTLRTGQHIEHIARADAWAFAPLLSVAAIKLDIRKLRGDLFARSRIDLSAQRLCSDIRFEVSARVVEPTILRRVSDHALHIRLRFLEGNCLDEFIDLDRQAGAPRTNSSGTGVVGDGDVFDAPELVELVAHVCSSELDVSRRLKQGISRDGGTGSVFSCGHASRRYQKLHQAISVRSGFRTRIENRLLPDKPRDLILVQVSIFRPVLDVAPIAERIKNIPLVA